MLGTILDIAFLIALALTYFIAFSKKERTNVALNLVIKILCIIIWIVCAIHVFTRIF